ncbi:MAG: hypothetical protein EA356_14945 [Geminicoccaceae bacterium]|nr:MAG: hypothetical protein EA356_14945 [Geminicoccaceae bacterium]
MIRLDVRPAMEPGGYHLDRFDVLDGGRLVVARTRRPLSDAARALVAAGVDPSTLVTSRHDAAAADSFRPVAIGEAATWAAEESDRDGLRRRRRPLGTAREHREGHPRTGDDGAAGRVVPGDDAGASWATVA